MSQFCHVLPLTVRCSSVETPGRADLRWVARPLRQGFVSNKSADGASRPLPRIAATVCFVQRAGAQLWRQELVVMPPERPLLVRGGSCRILRGSPSFVGHIGNGPVKP